MVITVTGKSASGKTTFSSLLASILLSEGIDATLISVDYLSNCIVSKGGYLIYRTISFLESYFGKAVTEDNFWEYLMRYRSEVDIIDDPLSKAICFEINDIIASGRSEVFIIDWAMTPKTSLSTDFNILLTASSERRRERLNKKGVPLDNQVRRDKYAPLYDSYSYDLVFDNDKQSYEIDSRYIDLIKQAIIKRRGER